MIKCFVCPCKFKRSKSKNNEYCYINTLFLLNMLCDDKCLFLSNPSRNTHATFLENDIQKWMTTKQLGSCHSVAIPNRAIEAYGKLGRWMTAARVLREMREMNLKRDVVSFNLAINACGRNRQWECAFFLLQQMKLESIEPDMISYITTISACEEGLQWEKASQLRSEMKSRGLQADVISRAGLTSGYEKGLQSEKVSELRSKMNTRGL